MFLSFNKKFLMSAILGLLLSANSLFSQSLKDTIFNRNENNEFAFGADISWLSQLESWGTVFRDDNGVQKDLMVILKEHGINALRFRVWVNPSGGWSGKTDVLNLCKRADKMGFKIMIDFHYSDSWADPGKQTKPAAWASHNLEQLQKDVYDHTYDILKTLKNNGITPAWVQVGNETKRGMLWPEGSTDTSMKNFAMLVNSGYDAIKAVDSTMQAIVHLPDGDENSLFRWMFDGLKKNGAKWDIIGMSAYPHWAHLDSKTEIDRVVANMKDMVARYNTKVMVVETGYEWDKPYEANNFLVELMDTLMDIGALGSFYWEPESMTGYALGAWDPNTKRPTIAMDAYLGIKHIDPATVIKIKLDSPLSGSTFRNDEKIELKATASHLNGSISKVTFYVNDKPVAVKTEMPYTFQLPNPGVGNFRIYATATDSDGYIVKTEVVSIQIGIISIFQENTAGYCGMTNNAGTIDSNHPNYTGAGFINSNNEIGASVNWTINFPKVGIYKITFRYAATSARPGTLKINGKNIGTIPFASTGAWDTWDFSSLNYTVSEAGAVPVSVISTKAEGLPNIDYLSIQSMNTDLKTEPGSCMSHPVVSSISDIETGSKPIDKIFIYRTDGLLVKRVDFDRAQTINALLSNLEKGLYIIEYYSGREKFIRKHSVIK